MIETARSDSNDFTIHLTNHVGENNLEGILDNFFDNRQARGRTYAVNFRNDAGNAAPSLHVDLLEALNF